MIKNYILKRFDFDFLLLIGDVFTSKHVYKIYCPNEKNEVAHGYPKLGIVLTLSNGVAIYFHTVVGRTWQ